MKSYRIKFVQGWYIPQYRYKYFPFWFKWGCSHTGHDWSDVMFYSEEDARDWIEKDKQAYIEWDNTRKIKTLIIKL